MTKLLIVLSDLATILTNTCLLTASVSDLLRLSGVISFLGLHGNLAPASPAINKKRPLGVLC